MNNSRLVVLLIIIFIVGVTGIYWIYQSQVDRSQELLPVPSPIGQIQASPSSEPSPSLAPSIAERNGSTLSTQPEAGFDLRMPLPELPRLP